MCDWTPGPCRLLLHAGIKVAALCSLAARLAVGAAVPYSLPVLIPPSAASPPVATTAPYTPTVMKLLAQLLPHDPPSADELVDASTLLVSSLTGTNPSCHNLARVAAKTPTTPSIMPLCFTDGLGIEVYPDQSVTSGAGAIETTALASRLALGSTFDRALANAVGQLQGREGRSLMVTGLLGPQLDTDVFINWHRGLDTPGEDPWLNGVLGAAEIGGVQGQGLMAQVKHFAAYNGTDQTRVTWVEDQALHELLLLPYELALTQGAAASVMCSYQTFRDTSLQLPLRAETLAPSSPFARDSPQTWPLSESHFGCEQPLTLTYVLRDLWGSKAFVGTDYGAAHSANAILQGDDREDPDAFYLDGNDATSAADPTSSSCGDGAGHAIPCDSVDARRIAGIPGPGCTSGCGVAHAVANGSLPLAVLKQALARVLYQEERFGMLGCDNVSRGCANPGGIGADRSGTAPLPAGASAGAVELGSKNGDAAIVEKEAEEGAVLLKNDAHALPISPSDLKGGIAVSGGGAEYLIAGLGEEGSNGFADRIAVNPLQQLQQLSGHAASFSYTPANAPTGLTIACAVLRSLPPAMAPREPADARCRRGAGLQRLAGSSPQSLKAGPVDRQIDFGPTAAAARLPGARIYQWQGWLYVPRSDSYVFRIQHSANVSDEKIAFWFDGNAKTLTDAASFYHSQYYGLKPLPVTATRAGFIEPGLRNRQCATTPLPLLLEGRTSLATSDSEQTPASLASSPDAECPLQPAIGWHRVVLELDARELAARAGVSLRLAYSRSDADIAAAAQDATHKAMALVFVNDEAREVVCEAGACQRFGSATRVSSLLPAQRALIDAVAAVNANTVVVLNTGTPVVVKEWIDNPHVKAVLNLWYPGQEGGTASARLLLGEANPSGHTSISWPRENSDTLYSYVQPRALYPQDLPGRHAERLDGAANGDSIETQGIFSGYRYYDALGLAVQFPFGYGLSYTQFAFSALRLTRRDSGGVAVEFDLQNTGALAGDEIAQVYVGPGPALAGVQQAVRSLRGFERLHLQPGQSEHIAIELDARSFQYWSEVRQQWIGNCPRIIYVGDADDPGHLPLAAQTAAGCTP